MTVKALLSEADLSGCTVPPIRVSLKTGRDEELADLKRKEKTKTQNKEKDG